MTDHLQTGALRTDDLKPNIILINIDDLGWTDLGFMGSTFYETPNIDRLAAEGCIFTNAYACAANCAPSRAGMMTGLQPSQHGVYTVGSSERGHHKTRKWIPIPNENNMSPEWPTIASALKMQNYRTGIVGKWHLSDDPLEHGFDINIGGTHKGHPGSYFAPYGIGEQLADAPDGEYLPDRLCESAIEFIQDDDDRPYFLYYSTYLVHMPLEADEKRIDKYKEKARLGDANENHYNPIYAAMIESLDICMGKFFEGLKASGKENETLVIFISDNGGIRSISKQNPLKAGKGSYYEGGVRVPMFTRWPRQIPSSSIENTPISNLDFFPSCLALAGSKLDQWTYHGENMADFLLQKPTSQHKAPDRHLLWHFPIYLEAYEPSLDQARDPLFRTRPGTTLRHGAWKLHHYMEDDSYELYNLEHDMGESSNLAQREPERCQQMIEEMDRLLKAFQLPRPSQKNPEYDESFMQNQLEQCQQAPAPSLSCEKEWARVMGFID